MRKFRAGDKVVCINNDDASELLELGHYEILEVLGQEDCYDVQVEKGGWFYFQECFELFSEWASHQVPINTETELSLTKLQVKMLQEWKKGALYLLSKTSHEDMIPTTLREEIDYFLVNNKLEGFDE